MLVDLSPLRHKSFRNLYLSQLISMFGSQMSMVTVPFQIYELTHSTFHTGLVSTVELVCLLLTVFWGGVLADTADRRRLLIISEILMGGCVGILALNALLPSPSLAVIYIAAGLLAGVNGIHRPAFEALTPMLVPASELARVSPLAMLRHVSAALVGPPLAGMILSAFGASLTYGIDVLSFTLSLFFLLRLEIPKSSPAASRLAKPSILGEVREAAVFLRKRRDILGTYLIDFFAMVFCMPQVLFPALAEHYAKKEWLGVLYSAVALGALVASLFSRWTSGVRRLGLGIALAASGWAASLTGAGASQHILFVVLGLFLGGAFDGVSGILRTTMWNESIPETFRGRLASFNMLSYMSGPLLGNTVMGFCASLWGVTHALVFGGLTALATVGLAYASLPELRAYRSPSRD